MSDMVKLHKFLEGSSDVSLGDLVLRKYNDSSNSSKDFHNQVQTLLQGMLKLMEFAESWAQAEAETRYVNYVRESAKQRREAKALTREVSVLKVTNSNS